MIAGFRLYLFLTFAACASAQAQTNAASPADAGAPPPAAPTTPDAGDANIPNDPAVPLLKKAYALVSGPKKDLDAALPLVDEAVKDNPKSYASLILRGMIYSQKKEWTSSENDFNAALAIDPTNMVVKFNLGEIKFLQKQYAEAKSRFLPLVHDKGMGDFANYKVYLCDLFGGNEIAAKQTLDGWDEETGPSFFWGTAAWDLVHKNQTDARSWITSAIRIFPPAQNNFYAQSLVDLGYLPLPPPPAPAN